MGLLCKSFILLFFSLILMQVSVILARPKRETPYGMIDPIAGHEFLNLFLEHDDLQKRLHKSEYVLDNGNDFHQVERRGTKSHRYVDYKALDKSADKTVRDDAMQSEDTRELVKLVTSGSKIIFFDDYDEESDAVLDAEVRDIDLQKNVPFQNRNYKLFSNQNVNNPSDLKIAAAGVSTSSQSPTQTNFNANAYTLPEKLLSTHHNGDNLPSSQTNTTTFSLPVISKSQTNFTNYSRMNQSNLELQKIPRGLLDSLHNNSSTTNDAVTVLDSENSASSKIRKVLPLPAQGSVTSAETADSKYPSNHRNSTDTSQDQSASLSQDDVSLTNTPTGLHTVANLEEQLLPIQTVIYHDTKKNHGPQSRSISYSSISQNIDGLKNWQESDIVSAVKRNITDSLKRISKTNFPPVHQSQFSDTYSQPSKFYSEPAKVYSQPAKVYGEPSKFYSEPAKVYSQPSKVYSEPAKSYWPPSLKTNTSNRNVTPSSRLHTQSTSTYPFLNNDGSSRKPAIVSRIAFGQGNQTMVTAVPKSKTTAAPTTTMASVATTASSLMPLSGAYDQQQYTNRNYFTSNNHKIPNSSSLPSSSYHIEFNLDKLPNNFSNAPQPPAQQHNSQHNANKSTKKHHQPQQEQQKQLEHYQQQQFSAINPCLESAVSTLFSAASLTSQTQQLQPNPNPSTPDEKNTNVNVNGLPHADIVRCVAELSLTTPRTKTATVSNPAPFHKSLLDVSTPNQNSNGHQVFATMTNDRNHDTNLRKEDMNPFQPTPFTPDSKQPFRFRPLHQRIQFGTKINSQATNKPAVAPTGKEHSDIDGVDQDIPDDYYYDDIVTTYKPNDYNDDSDDDGYGVAEGAGRHGNYTIGATNSATGDDDSKVAYVVEGRNYRKYRVEEKTDDGFIVGEYGVVDHQDGNLRGVRYTADSNINPSLIHKALLTFLKLQ